MLATPLAAQIDGEDAVKYSAEYVRTSASSLAQSYYWAQSLTDRWVALGSGQVALDSLRKEIRACADFIGHDVHQHVHRSGLIWQSYQSQSGAAVIPNTGDTVADGLLPAVTGAQANLIITRLQEFLKWGDDGPPFTAEANKGGGGAHVYTIQDVGYDGGRDPTLATAGLFITRLNELIADYDEGAKTKLNTILAAATSVNPPIPEFVP
jgi:hypothetical protein